MGNTCCANNDETGTVTVALVSSSTPPPVETPQIKHQIVESFKGLENVAPKSDTEEPLTPRPKEKVAPQTPSHTSGQRTQLQLAFKDDGGKGQEVSFMFMQRPLGMDFHRSLPIMVKKVHPGSVAEQMGVGVGHVLTKVDDADISSKKLEEMHVLLTKVAGELPTAECPSIER
mmetsp:Transcript_71/g.236  ORF Transcript_71/g.236 Transcript_71/m.236 type:complete len:173 (+) Transcript_71:124-642(+)|eukprot:CAMPEP_0183429890 /NCGR_PEP_ID=MMETSP0370-20130417/49167_1 /TAXON_ID=268820 /ORGANISM="Peridinium aciculiferum, Strain PAER-2" /LENGTH=172 /DNA_ID=CAMNT_0025615045 /DNA_START=123 /DNA_END=641 /DNA_ORIENTATION=+